MLVLSRRTGERILIASNIVVTVLNVRGGRVRIGIEAAPAVGIRRAELPAFAEAAVDAASRTTNSTRRLGQIRLAT